MSAETNTQRNAALIAGAFAEILGITQPAAPADAADLVPDPMAIYAVAELYTALGGDLSPIFDREPQNTERAR